MTGRGAGFAPPGRAIILQAVRRLVLAALAAAAPGCTRPSHPSAATADVAAVDESAAGNRDRNSRRGLIRTRPSTTHRDAASASAPTPALSESLDAVLLLPPAAYTDVYFRHYGINPTIDTEEAAVSSFALDVDTASFGIARAELERGVMPQEAAVRVEEFVNAFDYDYAQPAASDFSVQIEVSPSERRPGFHTMVVGLRARDVAGKDRAPAHLVFVIDRSSSMAKGGRLPLVQDALRALAAQLGPKDSVAIVAYGNTAEVVLEPTPGNRGPVIEEAISGLVASGSAEVDTALRLGYELAARTVAEGAIRRVVLCTDGVVTGGPDTAQALLASVADFARRGVSLSAIGVGMDDYDDVLLEQLANRGDGTYDYVDRMAEAERMFLQNLTGTVQVVARDAKVQIEFDPEHVARYRLIGYENRGLSADAFASEDTDAGEIGAGHEVTALYELQFRAPPVDAFGTLRLRYRRPHTGLSAELVQPIAAASIHSAAIDASPSAKLAMAVAAYAEKLRGSYWIRGVDWPAIEAAFSVIPGDWQRRPEVAELGQLIGVAARLDRRSDRTDRDLAFSRLDFERMPVLQ